ncbi:sensor histidine kinase [Desmospora activa]|uniref:histidine kinase n=1 Tax=Desmospora activa DSM 45169 TaxID=1121389 RepID=A0A2T4Z1I1_9BACL|nr:sensor histidine kinase [Desmospora activa]PTM54640.1 two-component system nitrate/nitrite sensor histidine kinase NarQ [Desmospora activa DSM 45169]
MSDKQIKWLILIIPTIVIGLWEYVRHEFLLPYISMELGNWLSPIIVFFVTMTFLVQLFKRYEQLQEQLKKERTEKAILQERERIARELHDGIAQSLFLCSVQISQMKQKQPDMGWEELDKSLRQIHNYVRHSISNLKGTPASTPATAWKMSVQELVERFQFDTGVIVELQLELAETQLSAKEKVELFACIQEALTNIRKHAHASHATIRFQSKEWGWCLEVEDNGQGFHGNPFQQLDCFGLRIMQERVREIKATLTLSRQQDKTRLVIQKEKAT